MKAWENILAQMQQWDNNGNWIDETDPLEMTKDNYNYIVNTLKEWQEGNDYNHMGIIAEELREVWEHLIRESIK